MTYLRAVPQMQSTFVAHPLVLENPTFTSEQELPNGFIILFRNIPIAGPLIEDLQETDKRERVKCAIKRLIVTGCGLSPVLSSLEVFKAIYAALLVTNVVVEVSISTLANEQNYIDRYIDSMDDDQFDFFYTVLACGILAPLLFDSEALNKVLEIAWMNFTTIMKSIQKGLETAAKVAWNFAGKPTVQTIKNTKQELALIGEVIGITVDVGCYGAAWLIYKLDSLRESLS